MVSSEVPLPPELAQLRTLQEVLQWGFGQAPPWEVVEVVVQDEYCHDVVMSGPLVGEGRAYLCFDTT